MKDAIYTSAYRKGQKRMSERGKMLYKLWAVEDLLLEGGIIDPKYEDHPLKGYPDGRRDIHVEGDWVVIYIDYGDCIKFLDTGTHSDLRIGSQMLFY